MSEDLIRRSDAIKAVKAYLDLCCLTEAQFHKEAKDYNEEIARDILDQITPSIDIEPKCGKWIDFKNGWKCNACEKWNSEKSNFCPNCGADMRPKGADDE